VAALLLSPFFLFRCMNLEDIRNKYGKENIIQNCFCLFLFSRDRKTASSRTILNERKVARMVA
jgi:hypothetical protein